MHVSYCNTCYAHYSWLIWRL